MTRTTSIGIAVFVACSCAPAELAPAPDSGPAPGEVPVASCDAPVGGPDDWTLTTSEGDPGYDDELAALDLDALPGAIDLSGESDLARSIVAFMLDVPGDSLGVTLNKNDALARGELGRAVLGAVATSAPDGTAGFDTPFLRRGLHRYYACDRGFPLTLDGFFATVLDHRELPSSDVTDSRPKGGLRRLYESGDEGVYVAETIEGDGSVRETEILLEGRRGDGALDFVVYDRDGNLADRSEFSTTPGNTVIGASPYTCMTCHRDDSWRFSVLVPDLP